MKFILGIAAGKGGVGKSSLTANLALFLHKMGIRIGVIDADIYGPSMRRMLPDGALPYDYEGHPGKLLPAQCSGIKLISVAHFLKENAASILRAPLANGMIKNFIHNIEWGEVDCLLIDFPPGTGDVQITLMQEARLSGAIVITTPQDVALQDVSKAIFLFHRMQVPVLGVVENMSYFQDPFSDRRHYPFGRGGGKRLALEEGLPFLGEIPIDEAVSRCCDAGASLFEQADPAPSVPVFEEIAKEVWQQLLAFEKLEGKCLKNFKLHWKNGC
jgi:ATP-binding protein involved in chromosome partitioning